MTIARPTPRDPSDQGLMRRGAVVIWRALRSAPRPFGVGILGSLVYAAMIVAASLVIRWVTDEVLVPAFATGDIDRGLIVTAVVAIVGVGVVKAAGVVGRRLGAYVAQYGLQAMYRRKVTRRYLELPIAWHRRHPTGVLLSNANADVDSAFFVAAPLPMAFGATVLLAITAGLLVVTDPFLAAIGFSVGPLLAFANWYYQRRMRHAATVAQQARATLSEVAHESFDAALVVKTLGREAAETERFRARSEDLRDRMIVVGRLRAFFDPVIEALPNVGILLVLLVGALRVRDGALTAGDLMLFAYLFRLVALPMRVFGWLLGELPRAVVGWDRVQRVLTATGEMRYGRAGAAEPIAGEGAPAARDGGPAARDGAAEAALARVAYRHPPSLREDLSTGAVTVGTVSSVPSTDGPHGDGSRGVRSITFTAAAGRTIAVVGATGSGKSTVAALLVRLFDPDTGRVTLDGRDLRDVARDRLASDVAIVFQEAFLFDDTVRGNITLGADLDDDEVEAAARLARAHDFVTALPHGYDTPVGERGASLSGGQRQRIALARALVRRPRLLVLDDATSAVDPAVESEILRGLAAAELPATTIVIAYRRGSIAMADEVVFVRDGVVAAAGPHEQLLRDVPDYARLVTAYERREREGGLAPDDGVAAGPTPDGPRP